MPLLSGSFFAKSMVFIGPLRLAYPPSLDLESLKRAYVVEPDILAKEWNSHLSL